MANENIISAIAQLSDSEKAEVLGALRGPSKNDLKRAASPFRVGDTVTIAADAKSVKLKAFRGMTFTVTHVGTKGRLYGDNPANADKTTGLQIDPAKRIWVLASECTPAV